MTHDFAEDIAAVRKIDVVPRILEVVCRTTGMKFAAVARVTEDRWIACAVRDDLGFGLQPGGELDVKTTICDEIRASRQLVAIDHVDAAPQFCAHHTPKMYGFQSYISVPLCRPDGSFFGTLCAIDPTPAHVNNVETIGMFSLFADLIGYHLAAQDRVMAIEQALAGVGRAGDLRQSLATIEAGARALSAMSLAPPAQRAVDEIYQTVTRLTGPGTNPTSS